MYSQFIFSRIKNGEGQGKEKCHAKSMMSKRSFFFSTLRCETGTKLGTEIKSILGPHDFLSCARVNQWARILFAKKGFQQT
jgi:hypothetical protein